MVIETADHGNRKLVPVLDRPAGPVWSGPPLADGHPAPAFGVDEIGKDMRTMLAEAEARGVTLPLTEAALRIYDEASRNGWAGRDGATLAAYWPNRGEREGAADQPRF